MAERAGLLDAPARPSRPPAPVASRANVVAPAGIPPAVGRVGPAPGEPLPEDVQRSLSATFGTDVSRVRVHTDTSAADRARALGARAFTIGRTTCSSGAARGPPTCH